MPTCVRMVEKRNRSEKRNGSLSVSTRSARGRVCHSFIRFIAESLRVSAETAETSPAQTKQPRVQALPQEWTHGTPRATHDTGLSSSPFCLSRPQSPSSYQDLGPPWPSVQGAPASDGHQNRGVLSRLLRVPLPCLLFVCRFTRAFSCEEFPHCLVIPVSEHTGE